MSRRAVLRACPSLLLAAAVLSACGDGGGTPAASPGTTPASSPSASAGSVATGSPEDTPVEGDPAPAEPTPFPGDARPDEQEASADSRGTVAEIRTGRQQGFDRVVFEVGGTGTPGWDVRYVDQASSQGSGAPVEVAGEAVLQVTLTGMGYPYDTGVEEWSGPDPLPGSGTQVVTEVAWDATFEGTSVAFVGTAAEVPFRVYALAEPTRIVVDIADRG
ncbi:AMIN-like domain-containing (lipo)protein [Geodermatophilus sp. CPCC 206100]|uniref:AMIN-like domain-containing (lipo)protein n=1 Tax=Geodermatophilus sp. CPCC 206100 TaxID=3020054 RepID=UPI003B003A0B